MIQLFFITYIAALAFLLYCYFKAIQHREQVQYLLGEHYDFERGQKSLLLCAFCPFVNIVISALVIYQKSKLK